VTTRAHFRRLAYCAALAAVFCSLSVAPVRASKWTGPQFVVAVVKVTALKPCPAENIRVEFTEWVLDRFADCVLVEAQPQEVPEMVSSWSKDSTPFLKGSYYFTAKKTAVARGQRLRVLLRPGPLYGGKLDIVGQKIETRIVEADTYFWYSELNVLTPQANDRVRLELRFSQRQIGRLAANPRQGYSLLLDLKKSCTSPQAAKNIDIKACASYADFRHSTRARTFQTNRVSGTLELPRLDLSKGFATFIGELDISAEGNPELENSVGSETARFAVHDNGDIAELPPRS
jgi:hypothetical protein